MKKLLVALMGALLVLVCSGTVLAEDTPSPTPPSVEPCDSACIIAINSHQVLNPNTKVSVEILGFEAYDSTKMALPYNTIVCDYFELDVLDKDGLPTHKGVTLSFDLGDLATGATSAGLVHVLSGTPSDYKYELVRGTLNGTTLTVTLTSTSPCAIYITYGKYGPVVNTGIE